MTMTKTQDTPYVSLHVSAKIRDRWYKATLITKNGAPKLHIFTPKAAKELKSHFSNSEKKPGTYYEMYVLEMGIRVVHEDDIEFSQKALRAIEKSKVVEHADETVARNGAPRIVPKIATRILPRKVAAAKTTEHKTLPEPTPLPELPQSVLPEESKVAPTRLPLQRITPRVVAAARTLAKPQQNLE